MDVRSRKNDGPKISGPSPPGPIYTSICGFFSCYTICKSMPFPLTRDANIALLLPPKVEDHILSPKRLLFFSPFLNSMDNLEKSYTIRPSVASQLTPNNKSQPPSPRMKEVKIIDYLEY
ncbi:hypothetical protein I3843_06G159400 [Carya illinoinensis]|nr:hypothetical protein I3843_06G159400 [Carya illinoinensis]